MPNLKAIRKRISSVKNTQKITRAMKMVAGARLNRAQQRTTALTPRWIDRQHGPRFGQRRYVAWTDVAAVGMRTCVSDRTLVDNGYLEPRLGEIVRARDSDDARAHHDGPLTPRALGVRLCFPIFAHSCACQTLRLHACQSLTLLDYFSS